ncbi:MAG: hypothetical protein ACE5RL_07530 [Nitrosarchaeum sp.]
MLLPILVSAQQITNKFELNKDGKVLVSASSSNVQIEYWDQNYVEVKASIVGDYSEEQKKEMLKAWGVKTKGDKEVVIVTAGASQWKGERLNNFVWIEDGKEYEIITPDVVVPPVSPIPPAPPIPSTSELPPIPPSIVDIHVNIPKIPELEKMPTWPFNDDDDISVRIGDDVMKGSHSSYSVDFDKLAYEKNKKEYLAKLNKKFGTNVTQKEVDRWLEELAKWMDSIERKMEAWGEEFGSHMETEFGPEFEEKMEAWGEKFGKEFGAKMEAWEEKYGKDIEEWAKNFEKDFEPKMAEFGRQIEENLAPQLEALAKELAELVNNEESNEERRARLEARKKELTERITSRAMELKERVEERKRAQEERKRAEEARREEIVVRRINAPANRVYAYRTAVNSDDKSLVIKVPKYAQVELDVRYGTTELKGANDIQAHLNYTDLKADRISGDDTQIEVSQSKMNVENWDAGTLKLNFVNDCTIDMVNSLSLNSNTSDVVIGSINENAWLNGSFGNLQINEVGNQFKSIELTLENTEAKLSMPTASFDLYYRGIQSNWTPAKELTVDKTQMGNQEIIKGYHKSNSSKRSVHINARYSDLILE